MLSLCGSVLRPTQVSKDEWGNHNTEWFRVCPCAPLLRHHVQGGSRCLVHMRLRGAWCVAVRDTSCA